MQALAYAKINLSLEVLGRRADGYHQVTTVLHAVDLADRLTFEPSSSLSLECVPPLGPAEGNMVMQAARLLQQATAYTGGAAMTLEKRIPVASGLGGGSSDAATTLKALETLWALGLSTEKLSDLAARLGADVPFFLAGGCALAEGRGDVMTPLPPMSGWWAVVLRPPFHLTDKTAHLYGLLTADDFSDGSVTKALAHHLQEGEVSADVVKECRSAFDRAAATAFPGLEEQRAAMLATKSPFVRLSGSGPALFTLVQSEEAGIAVLGQLKDGGHEAYLARLLEPKE